MDSSTILSSATSHETETVPFVHLEDINRSPKLLQKSQLKSNIPKPVPYIRKPRELRPKSCSSSCFKEKAISSLCTPRPLNRSLSQNSPSSENRLTSRSRETQTNRSTQTFQSRSGSTGSSGKNQYSYVKAKVDNKTPSCLLLKRQSLSSNVSIKKPNDLVNRAIVCPFMEEPPGDQVPKGNLVCDEDKLENEGLKIVNRAPSNQSANKIHIPKGDTCLVGKQDINFYMMEGTRNYFLKECATEFLLIFEKQMEEVSELWLQLICDLVVTKMTIGKSALCHLSLQNPKKSWRDEIIKFFKNLPTQGELLYNKLCKIEEEQVNVLQVVMKNILTLIKEHKELKDKNLLLEETYDRTQNRLREELAILGLENKELDKKYSIAVEKYELEKLKTEEHEIHQAEIFEKLVELRKVVKHVEGKCKELENRGEKLEIRRQELEMHISNVEEFYKKENKKHEDIMKQLSQSEIIITELKQDVKKSENSKRLLKEKIQELQEEKKSLKTTLDNSLQKRTELEKEICDRAEKIKQLESEILLLKSNKNEHKSDKIPPLDENNLELVKDLVNDIEQRNTQIQELKKKINRLEHMLRDKSNREEKLLSQVAKLNKKCSNNCSSLNNQIKELKATMKSMQNEVSELEKVLGQKMLELDQRDRLIKELKELIRLKNESEHTRICEYRKHHEKKYTDKLMGSENDKESTYYRKKVIDVFRILEHKQMEIMKLENRIWGLQKLSSVTEHSRKEEK